MNGKLYLIMFILLISPYYTVEVDNQQDVQFKIQGMNKLPVTTQFESLLLWLHKLSIWPVEKICLFNLLINHVTKQSQQLVKYIFFSLTPMPIKKQTIIEFTYGLSYGSIKILSLSCYFIASMMFNLVHCTLDVIDFILYFIFAKIFLVNKYTPRLMNSIYLDEVIMNRAEYNKLFLLWLISILLTVILTSRLKLASLA